MVKYDAQVVRVNGTHFSCIKYFPDGSAWLFNVEMDYDRKERLYEVRSDYGMGVVRSRVSFVDALRDLFSGCRLNIQDNGDVIPCTPVECGGRDLFSIRLAGNNIVLENKTILLANRFVRSGFVEGRLHELNPSVWFGYYTCSKAGQNMPTIVAMLSLDGSDTSDWLGRMEFEMLLLGVRNKTEGGFMPYRLMSEVLMEAQREGWSYGSFL